jgi:hypothetical protein
MTFNNRDSKRWVIHRLTVSPDGLAPDSLTLSSASMYSVVMRCRMVIGVRQGLEAFSGVGSRDVQGLDYAGGLLLLH